MPKSIAFVTQNQINISDEIIVKFAIEIKKEGFKVTSFERYDRFLIAQYSRIS
jgi:hypothetical protein